MCDLNVHVGKLPLELLQKLVLDKVTPRRPEVLLRPAPGEDCAIIDFGEWVCVMSTDPITGAEADGGWYAVHVSCNDVAATGAEPVGVMLTILAPPDSRPDDLEHAMESAVRAASELGIEILGGHTEVTAGLPSMVFSCTAVGKAKKGRYVTALGARPGDSLVLSKAAGLEGTAILAVDCHDLLSAEFPPEMLERARAFSREISVVKDGTCGILGGARAMHDVTEGGVLGGVYEMSYGAGLGVRVWADRIPLRDETMQICRFFGIDPLRLISSGSMLIATSTPEQVLSELAKEGISGAIIGHFTDDGRRTVVEGSTEMPLLPPLGDELWKAKEAAARMRSAGRT
ncbi:MAG: AIR synthase family protein [Bacillota bacterium]